MTPRERLVTVPVGTGIDEARDVMHDHKVERVLVVDDESGAQRFDHGKRHY